MTGNRSKRGLLVSLLIVLALTAIAWQQRLAIYDWLRLRNYTPSAAVVQLANATAMNDKGRHLFYVNHPQLSDRASFNTNCGNHEESTIVLGCYITAQGIYVFDVTDARLAGVEEVTAAHEMLHAAYERLSDKERSKIDSLTQQAFAGVINQRLRENVESYRKKDQTVVPNELHSILGTEVRNLPTELENYYKKYFGDRLRVVSLSERYESEFTQREAKAANLENQIVAVRAQIDGLETDLGNHQAQLESSRSNITSNQQVEAFNAQVNSYNASIRYLNGLIDQHNILVEQYKQIVIEENELIKALDSRPTVQ